MAFDGITIAAMVCSTDLTAEDTESTTEQMSSDAAAII